MPHAAHLEDTDFPDEVDRPDIALYQARAADWAAGNPQAPKEEPAVLVSPATTRDQALAALKEIAVQGEGLERHDKEIAVQGEGLEGHDDKSHFDRFLKIYRQFPDTRHWTPTRLVPVNPNTAPENSSQDSEMRAGRITHPRSFKWAQLFNLRYRMLLNYLSHFLLLKEKTYEEDGARTASGYLLLWTFNEMRRLKKIAGKLATLPQLDEPENPHRAGTPFEMPYTIELPDLERSRWRSHRDVLATSTILIEKMQGIQEKKVGADLIEKLNQQAGQLTKVIAEPGQTGAPADAIAKEEQKRQIVLDFIGQIKAGQVEDADDPFLKSVRASDDADTKVMDLILNNTSAEQKKKLPRLPKGFAGVATILEEAVRGFDIKQLRHKPFWRKTLKDFLATPDPLGKPGSVVIPSDAQNSPLVKALQGQEPYPRMPAHRPPIDPKRIDFISQWIQANCPGKPNQLGVIGEPSPTMPKEPSGSGSGGQQGPDVPTFERDILPLFRSIDIEHMKLYGNFDLGKYEDVKARGPAILDRLKGIGGLMPPDKPWPKEQIDLFERWIKNDYPRTPPVDPPPPAAATGFNRIKQILDSAIAAWTQRTGNPPDLTVHGGTFGWDTKQQLADAKAFGKRLIDPAKVHNGQGAQTNLIIALTTGVPPYDRMPLGGPYVPDNEIQEIVQWIDAGMP